MTELEEMIELYKNGMPIRKIGGVFHHNQESISKKLKDAGVKIREPRIPKSEIIKHISEYILQGRKDVCKYVCKDEQQYTRAKHRVCVYFNEHELYGKYDYKTNAEELSISFWRNE